MTKGRALRGPFSLGLIGKGGWSGESFNKLFFAHVGAAVKFNLLGIVVKNILSDRLHFTVGFENSVGVSIELLYEIGR